jgi:hypothetical protein
MKNNISIIYLSIFFLLGMGFCLYFPYLLFSFTGLNIYKISTITCSTSSVYSMSLFIRQICANVFLYLLIYFCIFIQYRLKQSILNKTIMGATIIRIIGGFEGLGDPELDEQHESQKPMRASFLEQITQQVSHSKDNSANPEVNAVPDPYPPEGSNAKPSNDSSTSSGYPLWPRQPPAVNIPTLPESNGEPVPTNEDNKKVRINGYVEVKQITEVGLEKNNDDLIDAGPKDKLQSSNKKKYDIN